MGTIFHSEPKEDFFPRMTGVFTLSKRRCSAEKEHLARNAIFFRTRGEFETKFSLQKSQKNSVKT